MAKLTQIHSRFSGGKKSLGQGNRSPSVQQAQKQEPEL